MITTKLAVSPTGVEQIRDHVRNLLRDEPEEPKRKRLRIVQHILHDFTWGNDYTLDMRQWADKHLWDFWAVIPVVFTHYREELHKYLERSPLIKLAECAE